jgi:hypothetical protein
MGGVDRIVLVARLKAGQRERAKSFSTTVSNPSPPRPSTAA